MGEPAKSIVRLLALGAILILVAFLITKILAIVGIAIGGLFEILVLLIVLALVYSYLSRL